LRGFPILRFLEFCRRGGHLLIHRRDLSFLSVVYVQRVYDLLGVRDYDCMALVNRLDPLIPTFLNLEWIVRGLDVCLVWSVDNEGLGIRRMMQIGEVHDRFQRLDQERHRDILVLDVVRLDGDRGMFLIEDIVLQMSLEQWLKWEARDEV
jgi:hypothetical protein